MPNYELPGEPLPSIFPAHVDVMEFHGIEVLRIIGSELQVSNTTAMLDQLYPFDDKEAFGDAMHVGYSRGPGERGKPEPVYELIVLRRPRQ